MVLRQAVSLLSAASLERALAGLAGPLRVDMPIARLDAEMDRILAERVRTAPNAIIRSVYSAMMGRIGAAHAAVCRRRLEVFVNGARFAALRRGGVPEPELFAAGSETDPAEARRLLDKLPNYQIDLEAVCAGLERA